MKDFIAHYHDYLSVNMDAEVVVQLMISQELISEDIVMTAQSSYHKNCLILERLQYTDVQTLVSFCEMLKANNGQRTIGETLLNGKYKLHKLYTYQCLYFAFSALKSFAGEHTQQDDIRATDDEEDANNITKAFDLSLLLVESSDLKIHLIELLQSFDPKTIAEHCELFKADMQAIFHCFYQTL